MIRIFIGYDPRETVAYNVLVHSIITRSSRPVAITPICLKQVADVFHREFHPLQSTEFSLSRFLTPYLADYTGWSIFMDNDMLVVDDIAKLWQLRDERYAVQVVKHHHVPKEKTKFLGKPQSSYEKKNWSSVMLFNNSRCRALTPEYVSTASGLELHQFKWLGDDDLIGALPHRWNHLVDYDPYTEEVSILHYTLGGPYFPEYRNCQYADRWLKEKEAMLFVERRHTDRNASQSEDSQEPAVAPLER